MILTILSLDVIELVVVIIVLEMSKIVLLATEIQIVNYVYNILKFVPLGLVEFDLMI